MSDVLSEALSTLRLRSARYCGLDLRAPWALSYSAGERGVHVIMSGRCELRWADGRGAPIPLSGGDLVVMPTGRAHHLRSPGARGRPTPIDAVLGPAPVSPTRHGGEGEQVMLLCGEFVIDEVVHGLTFDALPEALVLRADEATPAINALLLALGDEVLNSQPGSALLAARLSDALVVQLLRHHAKRAPSAGWLGSLHDARLGGVLGELHREPAQRWTVASMARVAGMSRAAFAARFSEQLGEPPLRYLTRLRMHHAQLMLRESSAPMSEIAQATGYGSEAAFSSAFRRWVGSPPASYRRAHQLASEACPRAATSALV